MEDQHTFSQNRILSRADEAAGSPRASAQEQSSLGLSRPLGREEVACKRKFNDMLLDGGHHVRTRS